MLDLLPAQPVFPARVVIMGAGGFVGRATSRRLKAAGIAVVDLTRTEIDLLGADAARRLASLLQPTDTLVVTSAVAPVKDSAMLLTNLHMVQVVCAAVKQSPVRHLVYISSDAVYKDSATPLTEASCAEPASLHGAMHLTREIMLRHELPAFPQVFVRPTLIYGPGDPHNGYGPNRFARLALAGSDIVLFGKGEERRDHVYIDDVAEIVCRCVRHRATGIINAVSGRVSTFQEIARLAVALSGSTSRVVSTPRQGAMPHNGYRAFDVALLQRHFPDFAPLSLPAGLGKTISAHSVPVSLERP